MWALVCLPAPPVLAHINIAISRHVASQLSEVGPGRPTAADALAKGGVGSREEVGSLFTQTPTGGAGTTGWEPHLEVL